MSFRIIETKAIVSFNPQESDEQEGLVGRVRERGAGVARPLVLDLVDGPEAAARRHQRRLRPVRPRPLVEQRWQGKRDAHRVDIFGVSDILMQ